MDILYVILGLVFAVYGAQLLVDGGSAVAKCFNIPLNIRRRDER